MSPSNTSEKYVFLKCEDDSPSYDQSIHAIRLERETESAWYGKPSGNPSCPVLQYPRFAWKQVQS